MYLPFRLFSALLLLAQPLFGQLPVIDSLRTAYAKAPDDSTRWEINSQLFSFFTQVQADSALQYAERSYQLAQRTKDKGQIGLSLDILGRAYILKNEPQRAQEYLIAASEAFQEIGHREFMIDTESTMARVYIEMGDFENARKYLRRALNYYRRHPNNRKILVPLIRFSLLYEKMGEGDSLVYYAREALKAGKRLKINRLMANLHNNLASAYLAQQKYTEAAQQYRNAIEMAKVNDPSTLDHAAFGMASLFQETKQIDSSLHYSLLTVEWAKAFGDKSNEAAGYELAAKNYALKGDHEQAYQFLLLHNITGDSLREELASRDLSELNLKYETQKKETQIAQQQLLLEKEANRRNLILFVAILLLIAGSGLFLYLRNRHRIRQQQSLHELQLKEAEAEQLVALDQMKSAFFANISHEFRTPLTLLLGPLREMHQKTFRGDAQSYFRMMIQHAERLLKLVNQLLELSRLESGNATLNTQAIDLNLFLRSLSSSFENWAMRKQIHFWTDSPDYPVYVFADTDKIEKAIVNLLSNAIKFTPEEGRVQFEVRTLEKEPDTGLITLEMKVQDTGIGIPREHLPRIFDRFYTQAKAEDELGNIGIGLALTKELVELHGGTIQAVSEVNRGSTFTVVLPLQSARAEAVMPATANAVPTSPPAVSKAAEQASAKVENRNNPAVLVVEDNPDLRSYIIDYLQPHYRILEAADGRHGLELAVASVPDLVITDLVMPQSDGLELCHSIKTNETTSHIPVIMLTAQADPEQKRKGLAQGADAYLTKPFDREELGIRVAKLIERNQMLREKFALGQNSIAIQVAFANPMEASFLEKAIEVIEEQLDNESFSVEEMGKAMNLSRSQLNRKIKALTDMSPSVFLRTIRLKHAYRLLEQKAGNISEVAFKVGFSNIAYFSRCFSNQFGFPPSRLLRR